MRPFNPLRYFRFAAIGRVIILAVMAYRTLISWGSVLAAFQAVAAEQTGTAVVDKGTKSLDWWKEKISHYVDTHGPALAGAVIVLVAGFYASRLLGRFLASWLDQKPIEPPVRLLMVRVTRLLVIVLALVIALGTAGVDVTALVAGVGVAGVGVGLAMQGVLSNLVAGLTIIFTKPFRVGEYVEMLGVQGQVEMIELFSTTLIHGDRSRVVIPNRRIVGEILQNYGHIRQLDLTVGVAYNSDLTETIAIVRDILGQNSRVMKDPAAAVGVTMLADSSINIAIKPWTTIADSGPARAELYQAIVERFRERHISIPFPQREVRMLDNNPSSWK